MIQEIKINNLYEEETEPVIEDDKLELRPIKAQKSKSQKSKSRKYKINLDKIEKYNRDELYEIAKKIKKQSGKHINICNKTKGELYNFICEEN